MDIQKEVLAILHGGLWHTTSPQRFSYICCDEKILPDPPNSRVPDSERWGTAGGPDNYPFVRTLGGVSLFDFTDFEPEAYSEKYPLSSWFTFVPFREKWGSSVWIEIDREAVHNSLITPNKLIQKQQEMGVYKKLMPGIEAAHLGPISSTCWSRALCVGPLGFRNYPIKNKK